MTRIVVAAKQDKILLQDSQAKTVSLDQPAIIQIGVTEQDVKTLERLGDKLIISLNNGEQSKRPLNPTFSNSLIPR